LEEGDQKVSCHQDAACMVDIMPRWVAEVIANERTTIRYLKLYYRERTDYLKFLLIF
jgi:hypothetical protein